MLRLTAWASSSILYGEGFLTASSGPGLGRCNHLKSLPSAHRFGGVAAKNGLFIGYFVTVSVTCGFTDTVESIRLFNNFFEHFKG
jgi:hypothetical protein